MQAGSKVRRKVTVELDTRVRELVFLGYGAAQIHRQLASEELINEEGNPSEKTIQRMVKDYTPEDPSGPWSFAESTGEEARLILPVLAAVLEQTAGDGGAISRDIAAWIVRIRTAAPTLPPWDAYGYAILYRAAAAHKRDTRELDRRLARLQPPALAIDVPTATATAAALPPTISIQPQ
jgi:hypothetical protein